MIDDVRELVKGSTNREESLTLIQEYFFISKGKAVEWLAKVNPTLATTRTTKAEAETLGILEYAGTSREEVKDFEVVRKYFKVVPFTLEEQRQKRKEWLEHKKSHEWQTIISVLQK